MLFLFTIWQADKLRNITLIIADESHLIMNAILPSLSVNYGSVY